MNAIADLRLQLLRRDAKRKSAVHVAIGAPERDGADWCCRMSNCSSVYTQTIGTTLFNATPTIPACWASSRRCRPYGVFSNVYVATGTRGISSRTLSIAGSTA